MDRRTFDFQHTAYSPRPSAVHSTVAQYTECGVVYPICAVFKALWLTPNRASDQKGGPIAGTFLSRVLVRRLPPLCGSRLRCRLQNGCALATGLVH